MRGGGAEWAETRGGGMTEEGMEWVENGGDGGGVTEGMEWVETREGVVG